MFTVTLGSNFFEPLPFKNSNMFEVGCFEWPEMK